MRAAATRLRELLARDDLEAGDAWNAISAAVGAAFPGRAWEIGQAVERFDFAAALALLDRLLADWPGRDD